MADDVKSCGKKRSSIDCEEDCPFHRIGLPIMPLRYAVLSKEDTSPALEGDMNLPQLAERPLGDSARYGVRPLRPGYLYVYDEARSELKGYYVNENGTLYNFDIDRPVDACERTFTCTMDHQARASLLTIPNARKATFVWLTFSDVQWTKDVCKAHKGRKGADMRERHMFKFDVQAWLSSGKHPSAKSIKTLTDTVADCVLSSRRDLAPFEMDKLLSWSTTGLHDPITIIGGVIKRVAEEFLPGKGLLLALPDSTGILQDIARLMRRRFDDFVSNPQDLRPLTVSKSIESLSEIIMQSAESDFLRQRSDDASNYSVYGTTTPHMAAGAGGSGAGGLAVGQLLIDLINPDNRKERMAGAENYRHPTEKERQTVRWDAWKKYFDNYDENARRAWQKDFDERLTKFDAATIVPLAKAHVAWLTCEKTGESFQCNYDVNNADSGEVYQTVLALCLDGTQDKRICFKQYADWLQGDPTDTRNLLLRAMFHNQDFVISKVVEAHEAALDWKAIPWGNLHESYKTGLQVLSKGQVDKTARLLEQIMGPVVHVLRLGVDSAIARKLAMYLGLVAQQDVAIVEVEGGKKTFRAALIREVLRQHGGQVDMRQMERAVADELRRLEVRGEQLEGTDKKRWFMLVDKEAAAKVPTDLRAGDRARALAQATMTMEEYEARELSRWRTVINTDVRVGVVGCLFQTVAVYKLWSDLDSAMPHERSDASWKFVVGIGAVGGSVSEVLGKALQGRLAANMRIGLGVHIETAASRLLMSWGSRLGVVTGIIMAVFDFKSSADQFNIEKNGLMGGLYLASGILSLVVIGAFALSYTVVGLIAAVLLIIVAVLIEKFKGNKIDEWLKRCLWGKLQGVSGADYYYGLQQEVNSLRVALGGS
ncbi:T6SS effector BTH_I2691 family protein [Achromobacter dolens]|uniref:T6SS effector BTH_I2691 family protein n=2 Tax=Bacteria TaxID=2 RepID=UPI0011A9035A|nr:T6SS effector BTH_I2691 family protein [Achromobacter dolens]